MKRTHGLYTVGGANVQLLLEFALNEFLALGGDHLALVAGDENGRPSPVHGLVGEQIKQEPTNTHTHSQSAEKTTRAIHVGWPGVLRVLGELGAGLNGIDQVHDPLGDREEGVQLRAQPLVACVCGQTCRGW
jgi:hypothetical protein